MATIDRQAGKARQGPTPSANVQEVPRQPSSAETTFGTFAADYKVLDQPLGTTRALKVIFLGGGASGINFARVRAPRSDASEPAPDQLRLPQLPGPQVPSRGRFSRLRGKPRDGGHMVRASGELPRSRLQQLTRSRCSGSRTATQVRTCIVLRRRGVHQKLTRAVPRDRRLRLRRSQSHLPVRLGS